MNKPTDKQLDRIIKRWANYWFSYDRICPTHTNNIHKTKEWLLCDQPVSALHSLRETIKEIMRIKK